MSEEEKPVKKNKKADSDVEFEEEENPVKKSKKIDIDFDDDEEDEEEDLDELKKEAKSFVRSKV